MQAQAHPPRVASVLRGAAFGVLCGLGIPLLYLLPALMYDLLFRADHLLGYVVQIYGTFFSSLPSISIVAFLGLAGGFFAYSNERRQWKDFQEHLAHPAIDTLPPPEQRVEMPEPTSIPATQVTLGGQRTPLGFGTPATVLIWGAGVGFATWLQFLFMWPPNEKLQWTILGTSVVVAILVAVVTGHKMAPRPKVFGDLGITIPGRKSSRLILWSEVQYLLLVPVVTPEGGHEPHAAERYRIVTNDPEPLEISAVVENDPLYSKLFERENERLRAAIALAMRRTGLPLIADSEALRQREALLDPKKVSQARRSQYLQAAFWAVFFLALAIGASISFSPHVAYRTVSGPLTSYKWTSDQVTIQLAGDSTKYTLSTDGVWPHPPKTLPTGISVTMRASDQRIGTLDTDAPSGQFHIVTLSYTEPWTDWLGTVLIASFLLVLAVGVTILLVSDIWRRRAAGKSSAARVHGSDWSR